MQRINKHYSNIPLLNAALYGDTDEFEFKKLLAKGESPNICDRGGQTTAHWAAISGSVKILNLIDTALLSTTDDNGDTPLHKACWFGEIKSVKWFSKNHEELFNVSNKKGETPLSVPFDCIKKMVNISSLVITFLIFILVVNCGHKHEVKQILSLENTVELHIPFYTKGCMRWKRIIIGARVGSHFVTKRNSSLAVIYSLLILCGDIKDQSRSN